METINRLSERGIDIERLGSEFVSRQALHTYLTKARGVSYPEEHSEEKRLEKWIRSIQRLKSRASAVAERALEEFHGAGRVADGNVQVSVLVRAQCQNCGRQYPFVEFVRNGTCECAEQ